MDPSGSRLRVLGRGATSRLVHQAQRARVRNVAQRLAASDYLALVEFTCRPCAEESDTRLQIDCHLSASGERRRKQSAGNFLVSLVHRLASNCSVWRVCRMGTATLVQLPV